MSASRHLSGLYEASVTFQDSCPASYKYHFDAFVHQIEEQDALDRAVASGSEQGAATICTCQSPDTAQVPSAASSETRRCRLPLDKKYCHSELAQEDTEDAWPCTGSI